MNTLFAVDDGIVNGNFTFADIMFLVGFILFLVAGLLLHPRGPDVKYPVTGWSVMCLGLAAVALGWLVL